MSNPQQPLINPPRLRRPSTRLWALGAVASIVLFAIFGFVLVKLSNATNPLLGVWKATDEYGGQHFYEFHQDGSMLWWDIDRESLDSEPVMRGPFRGVHTYEEGAIIAKAGPFFAPRVGTLRWQGQNQLHQDYDGHFMRQNLTYKRVTSWTNK